MFQLKESIHRYIAILDNTAFGVHTVVGGVNNNFNQFAHAVTATTGAGYAVLVALDNKEVDHFIVSFSCQFTGITEVRNFHFVMTTFVTDVVPTTIDTSTVHSCVISLDSNVVTVSGEERHGHKTGAVLIPKLPVVGDQVQYVALHVRTGASGDGNFVGQFGVYDTEYRFLQPTK